MIALLAHRGRIRGRSRSPGRPEHPGRSGRIQGRCRGVGGHLNNGFWGSRGLANMPWLLDMEAPTCFIGEVMIEAIIHPTGCKLAVCSE